MRKLVVLFACLLVAACAAKVENLAASQRLSMEGLSFSAPTEEGWTSQHGIRGVSDKALRLKKNLGSGEQSSGSRDTVMVIVGADQGTDWNKRFPSDDDFTKYLSAVFLVVSDPKQFKDVNTSIVPYPDIGARCFYLKNAYEMIKEGTKYNNEGVSCIHPKDNNRLVTVTYICGRPLGDSNACDIHQATKKLVHSIKFESF